MNAAGLSVPPAGQYPLYCYTGRHHRPLSHLAFVPWWHWDWHARTVLLCFAAENLFLIHRQATEQKQKRFPRSVVMDIRWMLERGRKYGIAGKLYQHLDYLWRSCNGNLTDQADLFRPTYATETLKDQDWGNVVLAAREWLEGAAPADFTSTRRYSMPPMTKAANT